jgi:hypothetical protein
MEKEAWGQAEGAMQRRDHPAWLFPKTEVLFPNFLCDPSTPDILPSVSLHPCWQIRLPSYQVSVPVSVTELIGKVTVYQADWRIDSLLNLVVGLSRLSRIPAI